MKLPLALIFASACIRQAPPPLAPAAPPVEVKPASNRAETYAAHFAPSIGMKCERWSGAGTDLPDEVDSVLCRADTWLLYCAAPINSKPTCEMSIDWGVPTPVPPPVKGKKK